MLQKSCVLWSMTKYPSQHLTRACCLSQLPTKILKKLKPLPTMVVETTRVFGLKVAEVDGKDVEEEVAADQVVQAVASWA